MDGDVGFSLGRNVVWGLVWDCMFAGLLAQDLYWQHSHEVPCPNSTRGSSNSKRLQQATAGAAAAGPAAVAVEGVLVPVKVVVNRLLTPILTRSAQVRSAYARAAHGDEDDHIEPLFA